MMFAAFGLAIALSAFLAVNVALSIGVSLAAGTVLRALAGVSLRARARVLLALRLFPAAAAIFVAAALVFPSYVLLEPADAGERLSLPLAALAASALVLLAAAFVRGRRSLAATARLVRAWEFEAEPVAMPGCAIPVSRVQDAEPVFALVGWRRPHIYVSSAVLDALTPAEIEAAVDHERAHFGAGDNMKRLLMRCAPDVLRLSGASRAIEEAWTRTAEALADHGASTGRPQVALALAASLVKVARLSMAPAAGLPVSALHDGGDVESRVRRLVGSAAEVPRPAAGTSAAVAGLVAAGVILAVAGQSLPAVHGMIEAAVRLLALAG
jgi:Zn-dependent protease with chaperone function